MKDWNQHVVEQGENIPADRTAGNGSVAAGKKYLQSFRDSFWGLAAANYAVLLLFYNTFLVMPHYSTDTYQNYITNASNVQVNIAHGRYVSAALYKLYELLHFDYSQHVLLGELLFLGVYALAIAALTIRFSVFLEEKDRAHNRWKLDALFLLLGCNLATTENLLFPDIMFSTLVSHGLIFLSVWVWCTRQKKLRHYIGSFLLLCLALDMYQILIGIYVILGTAFVLLQFGMHISKKAVREELILLVSGVAAALQSLFLMKLPVMMGATTSEFLGETSANTLTQNARTIASSQKRLWFGFFGFMPSWAPAVFFGAALLVLVWGMCRSRVCRAVDVPVIVLAFLGCGLMPFGPQFLAAVVWMPPRTLEPLFSFILLPGLLAFMLSGKKTRHAILVIYAAFLVVLFVQVQKISINNSISAGLDKEYCLQINDCIEKYEQDTGNTVEVVAVGQDDGITYGHRGVDYIILDTNLSAFNTSYSDVAALSYYSGRTLQRREMTDEEQQKYFADASWDAFCPEEQLHFEGNTLYWMKY